MKTIKDISKAIFFTLIIFILLPTNLFSQTKVGGRAVISGIWNGKAVKYASGEIAVELKENTLTTQLSPIFKKYNAVLIQNFDKLGWGWITIPDSTDIITVISELQKNPAIKTVEPNFITHTSSLPNDPYFNGTSPATYPYQWALKNTGQVPPGGTVNADIDATDAWDITTGSSNVIIGILDTGIPMQNGVLSHPDLEDPNRIILGPNETTDLDGDRDDYGHGTHVTGIAAAETNNSTGIAGIDWNSKILVIKVFDAFGNGTYQTFYNGIQYAVNYVQNNPGYKIVINYSGGGTSPSSVMESAVSYANSYNVTIVASAGNDYGGAVDYPAAYSSSYSNVVAVSATDQNDVVASYSSVGPQVILSAPGGYGVYVDGNGVTRYNGPNNLGTNIYSTEPNYAFNLQTKTDCSENYGYLAGTSMAAPQVTGTIGLMLSANPNLTPSQIRQILESSASKVSGMSGQNFTNEYGYGRVNANQSLLEVLANLNQSTYSGASSDNHNRTLAKGNNLYETFMSGGEIFVRQSSNNGSTWNYTTRISSGNGNNGVPSMVVYPVTGTNDTVNVVWESSLGSNYYDIYYVMSPNSGATWSSPLLLEHDVLVSSYQFGGPQPVITGISAYASRPPAGPIQPMLPASYMHGLLVVYTSNSGLQSTYEYPGWGWSVPTSISTSAPGSEVWFPSLSSNGGNISVDANLSYDARYYHKIYSNSFDPYTKTWGTEAVVYDGSSQGSYDRQSCIAVTNNGTFDAWNSYNSTYGYYTVKFRMGSFPNTWRTWEWTYPGTTANYFYPSVASYTNNGTSYVAITDYSSPGNQVLLHKANISSQTFSTYTISSNASFPNLPNINNDCGNTNPVEVWTGSAAVGNAYQLSISNQNLPKEIMSDENSKITIYQRAISSGNARVELSNVSAVTSQGQTLSIPLKSFDYTKDADLSDPWQYLQTEDSSAIAGVNSVSLNLSVTLSNAKADSVQMPAQTAENVLTPTELDIYNGGELIYTRTLSGKDAIINKQIEFPIPGGTLLGLKPVVKFSTKNNQDADVKFSTIENTISTMQSSIQQLASNTPAPTSFSLHQNYPNPFNPTTIISYDLPTSGQVILKVYDILGKEVATLYNGNQNAGTYNVSFDATKLASGVYFYQLRSGNYSSIKKMVLLK